MQIQHMQWDQLCEAYHKYDNDPTEENLKQYELIEESYETSRNYKTLAEKGDQQAAFLKALDFADYITQNIRLYNVCRAKSGDQTTCGLAYPSKLWHQAPMGAWRFYCKVDWSRLVSAAALEKRRILSLTGRVPRVTSMGMTTQSGQRLAAVPDSHHSKGVNHKWQS